MSALRITLLVMLGVLLASAGWSLLHRAEPAPLPALRLEVQNGCGAAGLAALSAQRLTAVGMDVVRVGDAEHHGFARSVLVDRRGKVALTRRLAERIGPITVVQARRSGSDVDCVLILGADHASLRLVRQFTAHLGS